MGRVCRFGVIRSSCVMRHSDPVIQVCCAVQTERQIYYGVLTKVGQPTLPLSNSQLHTSLTYITSHTSTLHTLSHATLHHTAYESRWKTRCSSYRYCIKWCSSTDMLWPSCSIASLHIGQFVRSLAVHGNGSFTINSPTFLLDYIQRRQATCRRSRLHFVKISDDTSGKLAA